MDQIVRDSGITRTPEEGKVLKEVAGEDQHDSLNLEQTMEGEDEDKWDVSSQRQEKAEAPAFYAAGPGSAGHICDVDVARE